MPHKSATYQNKARIYAPKIVRKKSLQNIATIIIPFRPSAHYIRFPSNISILFLSIMILVGINNATISNGVDQTFPNSMVSNSSAKDQKPNNFVPNPMWSLNINDNKSSTSSKNITSFNDSLNYDYYYESLLNSFDYYDSADQGKKLDGKQESNFTQINNTSYGNEPTFNKVKTTKTLNSTISIANISNSFKMPFSKIETMSSTVSDLTTSTQSRETTENYKNKFSFFSFAAHPNKIMSFESIYRDRLMMDVDDTAGGSYKKLPQKKGLNIYFTLHNVCSNKNVQVFGQKVNAKASNQPKTMKFAQFVFETISTDNRAVRIKNAFTGRYICYDRQGRIVATALLKRRGLCDFTQIYGSHHFKYRSTYQPSWYLGFDPKGNPIMEREKEPSNDLTQGLGDNKNYDKCFRFTKITCASPPNNKLTSTYKAPKSHTSMVIYDRPIFNKLFNRSPAVEQKWGHLGLPPRLDNYKVQSKTIKLEESTTNTLPPFLRNYLLEEARRDEIDDLEDSEYADY